VSLQQVERIALPVDALEQTEQSLRAAGREGFEMFVLWSGAIEGEVFEVRTPHVPKQTAYRSEAGLLVRIEGQALHELNRWLYDNNETLGGQVHAHPTDAYHSETDDTYPIVTVLGGYSIVAADFCRRGLLSPDTAVYRLTEQGWTLVEPAYELIEVI
jgi:hypothetical protein